MSTLKETEFIEIFKHGLKIIPRTLSIKTLLSDRNLRRIDYKPYYQRNYVWDSEKQTFFIESILLGTEIPPLILYKSGAKTEVIDGRQRFETLKKFKENDFALSSKGLMALPALGKQTFNKLDDELKEIFWNSNIRVFEFEVIINIDPNIEDKVKKEIFRRYNTGITPLTSVEVDSAKYDDDDFSNKIEEVLEKDGTLYDVIRKIFFPNDVDDANLKGKMIDFLRRSYILPKYPISNYATGANRTERIALLYNAITQEINDIDDYLKHFCEIADIYNYLSSSDVRLKKNKLLYETILWAIMVMKQENVTFDFYNDYSKIEKHFISNIDKYTEDNSYFYKNIIDRYTETARLFNHLYGCNFDIYIKRNGFSEELKELKQNETEVKNVVQQLGSLRINKPSPVSKPVEEILSDVITNKYLIRPSYQRQEKITETKAASIIESILLGISLPPIFVYKRNNSIKEVIDGQQRLLSILAFIGKQYRDETDSLTYSKNNNFKLKKLNVLTELNGKNFANLQESDQDKILDFVIDEIVIEESLNKEFDPTDLFIRLNQKPYPIQQNSFEMWNSTVDKKIIEQIKEVTNNHITWFYSKDNSDMANRTDRMENEELITLLAYISYSIDKDSLDKILGTFKRIDRITCRIKDKNIITDYLNRLEDNNTEKEVFLDYINKTGELIKKFGTLFDLPLNKDTLTPFFNVKRSKTFRRSYQDFYITWLILNNTDFENTNKNTIKENINKILCLLKNADGNDVDNDYYISFIQEINIIVGKEVFKISING